MANEQNLIPFNKRSESEQRAMRSKGGRNSGKKRKQQKTVQELLRKFVSQKVGSIDALAKIADKAGVTDKDTIEDLFIAVCMINTLRKGDISKLAELQELLGERQNINNGEEAIIDKLNEVFGNVE